MILDELIQNLQKAKDYAGRGDVEVEFWCEDKYLELKRIGQFNIIPDVVIHLTEVDTDKQFEESLKNIKDDR